MTRPLQVGEKIGLVAALTASLIVLLGSAVYAQPACNNVLSSDILLTGRLCLGGECLDAVDFQNLKVQIVFFTIH